MRELRSGKLVWWRSFEDDPEADLRREEALLDRTAGGALHLFTYGWNRPVFVAGYGQRDLPASTVEACRLGSVLLVRRCSGGTAVVQGRDLNLSLALPKTHPWASGIRTLYVRFLDALRETLAAFGVQVQRPSPPFPKDRSPICFESWGDETLLRGTRKCAGGAQVRRRDAVLVHLTVLFTLDAALQASLFRVPQGRILRAMCPLPALPGLDRATLAKAFAPLLAGRLGLSLDEQPGPPVP